MSADNNKNGQLGRTQIHADEAPKIGKYRVLRKIGKGAMGDVWLGHHPELDIPIAIKILPSHLLTKDPSYLARFAKEARTAARINHHHVVHVYDAGSIGELSFMVMEFVGGGTLSELLDRSKGHVPPEKALEIIVGIGEALREAAKYNIIHRDIKPDNIMLDEYGTPKLADLGLAKQVGSLEETSVTGVGFAVGTPLYMSPEQAMNESNIDGRTDIYSLGITFYRLVTGDVPFVADSVFAVMMKHVNAPTPHPRTKKSGLPDSICAIILKMIQKDPARYQTPDELLADLYRVRDHDATPEALLAAEVWREFGDADCIDGEAPVNSGFASRFRKPTLAVAVTVALIVAALTLLVLKTTGLLERQYGSEASKPPGVLTEIPSTEGEASTALVEHESAPPRIVLGAGNVSSTGPAPAEPTGSNAIIDASSLPVGNGALESVPVSSAVAVAAVPGVATVLPTVAKEPESEARSGQPRLLHTWSVLDGGLDFAWVAALDCWVGITEITNAQYRLFRSEHDSGNYDGQGLNHNDQPVVQVSYDDAASFAKWLSKRERAAGCLPDSLEYRLPEKDEWLTIARCGDERKYPWGDEWPPIYGNFADQTAAAILEGWAGIDDYRDEAAVSCVVANSGKNDWGFYGVCGNVWEWTQELNHSSRVVRGASWYNDFEEHLRCDARDYHDPDRKYNSVGFRLVLAPLAQE